MLYGHELYYDDERRDGQSFPLVLPLLAIVDGLSDLLGSELESCSQLSSPLPCRVRSESMLFSFPSTLVK